ncbi:unnamed protein product [Urochloa humidicola]
MAPPTRRRKRDPAAAAPEIDPADHFSKLPDEILAQILSFLPAREAVRTCALARAWRDVWRITRRLLITADSVWEARRFVSPPAPPPPRRARGRAPRRVRDRVRAGRGRPRRRDPQNEDASRVIRWIRRPLQCRVRMLRVDMGDRLDLAT